VRRSASVTRRTSTSSGGHHVADGGRGRHVSLHRVGAAGSYVLTFGADGFQSQTFTVELGEDEVVSGREVVLATEMGSITGTVVDDEGAPLGGVAVTVRGAEDPAAPADPASRRRPTP
jgi:hypothetical protein